MEFKTYEQMKAEFNNFYFKKVEPVLPEYEEERRKGAQKFIVFDLMLYSAIIMFLFIFFPPLSTYWKFSVIFFIITFALGICLFNLIGINPERRKKIITIYPDFEKNLKSLLMKDFLNIFSKSANWNEEFDFNYKDKVNYYRKINIFNPFPRLYFDDSFSLVFKDVKIEIFEVVIQIISDFKVLLIAFLAILFFPASWPLAASLFLITLVRTGFRYAPFKGIVVELKMNKKFKGHTFFLNKSFNSKKIKIDTNKFQSVNLESVDFADKYEVYSTDQVEARYILTTAMINRLDNLKLAFQAKCIRACFKDNKLILAIDTGKDMFAMGSDYEKSNFKTFKNLFNEVVSILKIVDQLKLYENTGL